MKIMMMMMVMMIMTLMIMVMMIHIDIKERYDGEMLCHKTKNAMEMTLRSKVTNMMMITMMMIEMMRMTITTIAT